MAITMIAIKSSITASAERNAFIACDTRLPSIIITPIAKAISVAVGIPQPCVYSGTDPAIKK